MKKLLNKTVLITGAGSRVGQEIALLYAAEGANIAITDSRQDQLLALEAEIKKENGNCVSILTDISKEEDLDYLIGSVLSYYHSIDIVINNTNMLNDYIVYRGSLSNDAFKEMLRLNIETPLKLSQKVIELFVGKAKGNIINITPCADHIGGVLGTSVALNARAVMGFTQNTGSVYAEKGIQCNCITYTERVVSDIGAVKSKGKKQEITSIPLLKKLEKNIARIALFLATADAAMINGTILNVGN